MYGAKKAGELLSSLGRLFTFYLNTVAFTCGIDDMLISVSAFSFSHNPRPKIFFAILTLLFQSSIDEERHKLLDQANKSGIDVAAQFVGYKKKDLSGLPHAEIASPKNKKC